MIYLRALMVAAVAAVLLAGSSIEAQGHGPDRGPGGLRHRDRIGLPLERLNLTDAQREQVRAVIQRHGEQMRTLIDRVRAAHAARREAVDTIPADEGRIRAAIQELAAAETELAIHRTRVRSDIFAILTPEQQAEAQKLRAERETRFRQRHHRMRERRDRRPQA